MDVNTIKGHGFQVGDTIEFYGMGRKHDLPAEEPTIVKVTKVGASYLLISTTDELLTWEFGASAKVWAAPVPTEPAFSDSAGDAFDFTQDGVTRRITVVNWEGGERGHYVCFVDTQGGRGSLHSNAWNTAMAMGDLVKIADGAPDGRNVSEACYAAASVDTERVVARLNYFSRTLVKDAHIMLEVSADAVGAALDAGLIATDGEWLTVTDAGMSTLTEGARAAAWSMFNPVVPVSVGDMVEDIAAERTFVITRADEYWVGMREVGTWREGRNIRTSDFRGHLADGALVVVNGRPNPAVAVFVDQDVTPGGHAAPQDARTAVISAPVAFRLGRGKRKASKRQARRNRGVSK